MLTAKQHKLLMFIQHQLEQSGVSPSFEEMKDALGLKSKSGVHRLVTALEERGFIHRLANRARALEVLRLPDDALPNGGRHAQSRLLRDSAAACLRPHRSVKAGSGASKAPAVANDVIDVPLHGRIAAGMPIEALEDSRSLPVPAALLGVGEHYALEVSGDSMVEAGILDGDYALVKRTDIADDGEIVVALVHGHEATLKYLWRQGEEVRLDPANSAYPSQIYRARDVVIQGKLAGLLRRYN